MRKFFQLVASLCFTVAGLVFVAGMINVIFGTHIGFGRGSRSTPLPSDLPGVIAVTDLILVFGLFAQLAAGPRVAWEYIKSHRAICAVGFLVLFVAPAGYIAKLAATPPTLRVAVKDGQNPAALDALLKQGANVNDLDSNGLTLLSYAMSFSPPEVIDKLLQAGAETNTLDQYGRSALMHCLAYRRRSAQDATRVVRALLSHGANPKLVDKAGKTTADYAKEAAAALSAPELATLVR